MLKFVYFKEVIIIITSNADHSLFERCVLHLPWRASVMHSAELFLYDIHRVSLGGICDQSIRGHQYDVYIYRVGL